MCKFDNTNNEIVRHSDGSINYQHYDNQARKIRSESIMSLLIGLFTGKKTSLESQNENIETVDFGNSFEDTDCINSFDKAA